MKSESGIIYTVGFAVERQSAFILALLHQYTGELGVNVGHFNMEFAQHSFVNGDGTFVFNQTGLYIPKFSKGIRHSQINVDGRGVQFTKTFLFQTKAFAVFDQTLIKFLLSAADISCVFKFQRTNNLCFVVGNAVCGKATPRVQNCANVVDNFKRVQVVLSKDHQTNSKGPAQITKSLVKVSTITEGTTHDVVASRCLEVRTTQDGLSNGDGLAMFYDGAVIISGSLQVHSITMVNSSEVEFAIFDLLFVLGFVGGFVNFSSLDEMLHALFVFLAGTESQT
mmetsp:Transcript_9593/g.15387  ORF Transcript_9593/g.15387 Transcript_9593/m.15387 type:complete len:281 (-) Transcript_9593:252-1094(-)